MALSAASADIIDRHVGALPRRDLRAGTGRTRRAAARSSRARRSRSAPGSPQRTAPPPPDAGAIGPPARLPATLARRRRIEIEPAQQRAVAGPDVAQQLHFQEQQRQAQAEDHPALEVVEEAFRRTDAILLHQQAGHRDAHDVHQDRDRDAGEEDDGLLHRMADIEIGAQEREGREREQIAQPAQASATCSWICPRSMMLPSRSTGMSNIWMIATAPIEDTSCSPAVNATWSAAGLRQREEQQHQRRPDLAPTAARRARRPRGRRW